MSFSIQPDARPVDALLLLGKANGHTKYESGTIKYGQMDRHKTGQVNGQMERWCCLVHPGVRDKRRVSEIDLSQPGHETAFWWRHNGPVTSQLTDRIKWPNYPVELIGIYVHINTHNKESLTQRYPRSTNVQLCLIFLYISIWFEFFIYNGWHARYFASQITVTTSP